jgi:histidinol-phosphate aminotransferase
MEFDLEILVRENIKRMKPYSSARHEFNGKATVFLDANESPFAAPLSIANDYNRYPDPLQITLKEKISSIKGVPAKNIFLGNGSDEGIDLLFRIFCEPGRDNMIIFPPTYGMYEVSAETNNIGIKKIPLTSNFELNMPAIEQAIDPFTKMIFICSPNNPTGNSFNRDDIEVILNNIHGLVVIDEAYINYSKQKTFIAELTEYPNLVILQTLSKAWGLAGLRLGMAFAGELIIRYLNKIKYPYNINAATQQLTLEALENIVTVNEHTQFTVKERERMRAELGKLPFTVTVYPSDANFLLVKMENAGGVYSFLNKSGIIVRDRSNVQLCDNCLRITIGTTEENNLLLAALNELNINS